jgi:predicted RNase H-like HicB family nuclease
MFDTVLAREDETRDAALALGALVYPEESSILAAAPRVAPPQLQWEGPDEDGDYILTLTNVPAYLTSHGKTHVEALARIGEAIHLTFCEECPRVAPRTPEEREADKTQMAKVSMDNLRGSVADHYGHGWQAGRDAASSSRVAPPPQPDVEELVKQIRAVLYGIDKEGTDDNDGWWETSFGAHFGAEKLAEVIAIIRAALPPAPSAAPPKETPQEDLARGGKPGSPQADLPRRNKGDK